MKEKTFNILKDLKCENKIDPLRDSFNDNLYYLLQYIGDPDNMSEKELKEAEDGFKAAWLALQ